MPMSCVRILVLSLLSLLATVWLVTNLKNVWQRPWPPPIFIHPAPPIAPATFDPRLYPEKHIKRAPKTIELDWVVRNEPRRPDGVRKSVYTINGLFPGPTVEARSGDRIVVKVHNALENETTAIHFHGIRQIGSNAMDGAPGVTQCAIPPKHSFLYNFTIDANQSGTYWWHSHSIGQQSDGLFGAFVVHSPIAQGPSYEQADPSHAKEDLRMRHKISKKQEQVMPETGIMSERIVLVGDWYHLDSTTMLRWYHSKDSFGLEPAPENALFNGVNTFNCSRSIRAINCDDSRGQKPSLSLDLHYKTRLRFINTGALADLEISLDSHTLLVIEADGSPVTPHRVNSVIISPGQRYSVIPEPQGSHQPREGASFWLRLIMGDASFGMANPALETDQFYLVFYGDSPNPSTAGSPVPLTPDPELETFNPLSLVPLHRSMLPQADQQLMIYVTSAKLDELGGIPYGYVNRTSWKPDEHQPLLLRQTDDWGKHQFVVTTHRERPSVVELIVNNMDDGPHPFHLHGHHFYPLHIHESTFGWGLYNFSAPPDIPDEAPVLRDTLLVPQRGHVVIRFLADAPGMWLFHCHMMVHLNTGMAMTFNVRPELISPHERQVARESCDMTA